MIQDNHFPSFFVVKRNFFSRNDMTCCREKENFYLLFIIYYLFPYPLFSDRFLKRDGELVRTACAFRATLNALETGNHVFCLLAFDQ